MKNNLTDITVVLDRSGSMSACRDEAENGLNHFVEEQKKHDGECVFTLVQFDTEYEFVHAATAIEKVEKLQLVPRGMTALLDAVGRAINECGERLSRMSDNDRPGLVVFVIVTDGLENSSHEFTKAQVKQLIERQQNDYSWQFTFLGANQDAFAEAKAIGVPLAAAANFSPSSAGHAFAGASSNVKRMRLARVLGQHVNASYTPDERKAMG